MESWESFDEMMKHIEGFQLVSRKFGHFHGNCEDPMFLLKATRETGQYGEQEGRWVIRYDGEYSYVSPALFERIDSYVHKEIMGQTLGDGTIMCDEKSRVLADGRISGSQPVSPIHSLGTTEKVQSGTAGVKGVEPNPNRRGTKRPMEDKQTRGGLHQHTANKRRKRGTSVPIRDAVRGGSGVVEQNRSKIEPEDVAVVGRMNEELHAQKLNMFRLDHELSFQQPVPIKQEEQLWEVESRDPPALSYNDLKLASSISRAVVHKYKEGDNNDDNEEDEQLVELSDFSDQPCALLESDYVDELRELEAHCVRVDFI